MIIDQAPSLGGHAANLRWLGHAIKPGPPLHRPVMLEMNGRIRLGGWLPFRAVQVHAPPDGHVSAVRARFGPLSISGFDRYDRTAGEMRWRLLGRVPLVTATGPDLDRSAAGRVALDALFIPAVWLSPHVTWREARTYGGGVEAGRTRVPLSAWVGGCAVGGGAPLGVRR
jgi:hypothetical protein